jgi:hypothetical protein
LSDREVREELLTELSEQEERVQELVRDTARVSADAEVAEPLVARELYDALREFTQKDHSNTSALREELINRGMMTVEILQGMAELEDQDAGQSLALTEEMLRAGYLTLADETEELAREGIGVLSEGVERAAERVLGDDTEALRRAGDQLELASEDLEREMAQALQGGSNPNAQPAADEEPTESRQQTEGSGEQARADASEAGQSQGGDPLNQAREGGAPSGENQQARAGEAGGSSGLDLERLLDGRSDRGGAQYGGTGPITGGDFGPWSDRLREVEELLEFPDLREVVASARERAREIRREARRNQQKPDWAVVELEVAGPLVEVRREIAKELARRSPDERLAPIDRDPVPAPYIELVRRYYEDLGEGE